MHVVPKLEKRTHGKSVTNYGTTQYMFPIGINKFQRGKNTRIDERIQKLNSFVVLRAFMAGAASQAGNADSSRAPGLTSGLQG